MLPAFNIALQTAGNPDPRRCVMIDDLQHTVRVAHQLGLFSILYGSDISEPGSDANATLADWGKLPELLARGSDHES